MVASPSHSTDTDRVPDPDPREPEPLTDHTKPPRFFALRNTVREFQEDECTDLAAGLTYYAVLSLFPALLVMISLLGVFGEGRRTTDAVMDIVGELIPASAVDTIRPTIQQLVEAPSAGLALLIGAVTALWTASAYVGAFGRAMNRVYEQEEGRPVWKLQPLQIVLTLAGLIVAAAVAFMLAVSGPVARAIGDAIGAGNAALTIWSIAKWPVILLLVVVSVAILYHATPNVKHPKFRWITVGAFLAIMTWIGASLLFGVIVFLLWLWITNLALLFGAELDAERERSRELRAGLPAERDLQLEPRDTRASDKRKAGLKKAVERARRLRRSGAESTSANSPA
jgi:membrane protein